VRLLSSPRHCFDDTRGGPVESGVEVIEVSMPNVIKMGGGPRCLTCPTRRSVNSSLDNGIFSYNTSTHDLRSTP
jgi:hypothetical protein